MTVDTHPTTSIMSHIAADSAVYERRRGAGTESPTAAAAGAVAADDAIREP